MNVILKRIAGYEGQLLNWREIYINEELVGFQEREQYGYIYYSVDGKKLYKSTKSLF